ncbi:phosphatidate cytidylyltransferase [Pedobacter puniceum]|jgi:phosphatidate cytidylyltransferase|uniref:Phosphatidate cytidylyltransferase n=1 Tax=Pedobacter puniceum TaxID=2666136 RepID=A0A7K0FNH3_9SPHI|nr:phosphatidate cytidylyltransferase [Pedobacter puniceum]MRX47534.1 phosphatidate cytidylyltransferase [Pedobacter puniceum]
MKTRAITGVIFILIMLCSLFLGPYVFTGFYIFLSLICLMEFFSLVKTTGIRPHRSIGYIAALIIFASVAGRYFIQFETKWLLVNIPLFFGIFVRELYKKSKIPFSNIAYTFLGLFYTIVPFIFFHSIAFISGAYNYQLALGFFLMLWANDTGAYIFGVKFGKKRLFERHSPKKSWEGFFGGVATSITVACILAQYFTTYSLLHWVSMATLISCFGTMGDLVESMFKRSIEIKDSGKILPGHGGLLDRFDGLLLSAPVVFVYIYLITY